VYVRDRGRERERKLDIERKRMEEGEELPEKTGSSNWNQQKGVMKPCRRES
jgi:hypothetical protein